MLTALVLGVFIPIVQATTGTANEVRSRVVVDVYVKAGATAAERAQLRKAIDTTANVKSVEFISKAEGLRRPRRRTRARSRTARSCSARTRCPTPSGSSRRTPTRWPRSSTGWPQGSRRRARAVRSPGIDEVRNKEHDTDKILSATGLVKILTAGLAVLLIFASVALVANTIRLSIFSRRREVEVMKLVGATNWFIRWPFVIEGVFVGFMGGVLAVLLLTIAKETFIDPLEDRFALLAAPDTIDFQLLIVVLLAACVAVSAAGQRAHAAPLPARLGDRRGSAL